MVMRNYKKMLSNLVANIVAYDNWSDEFSRKEINKLYKLLIAIRTGTPVKRI
jgi:hypothetical protein